MIQRREILKALAIFLPFFKIPDINLREAQKQSQERTQVKQSLLNRITETVLT